jgi:hypothetical protein
MLPSSQPHRSPERLGPEHIRDYLVHLFRDRKLSPQTIEGYAAALRFLFVRTRRRSYHVKLWNIGNEPWGLWQLPDGRYSDSNI